MGKLRSLPPLVGSLDMRTAKPAPKVAEQFYSSPEWRGLRSALIRQRGRRCERCGRTHEDDGSPVKLIGDHKRERKDGGAELDPANVELMCLPCHNAKTAKARARRFARHY